MKKFKPVLFVLLFSFVLFTSCRSEDDMNIDPPAEQALLADSTIANLMSRTSLNDGSFDNIIDNASCFQIQLPVTVTANGVQITVENTTDYDMIEAVFDANNSIFFRLYNNRGK